MDSSSFDLSSYSGQDFVLIIVGIVCASLVAIPLLLSFYAILLRTACYCSGAEVPGFFKSIGIFLVTVILAGVLTTGVSLIVQLGLKGSGLDPAKRELVGLAIIGLINIPLTVFIIITLYVWFLDVGYGRGCLIWFLQLLFSLLCSALIGGIGLGAFFLLRLLRGGG